jgi:hypothetical protein
VSDHQRRPLGLVSAKAVREGYADWSERLLPWEDVEAKLGDYLVEVGLAEPGDDAPYDAVSFRRQLEDKLTAAAATADAGYPDNEGLVIDPETGIPSPPGRLRRAAPPGRGPLAPR